MTIDLETLRNEEFPITKEWTFLNHATYGPLPTRHVKAAEQFLHNMSETMMHDLTDHWINKVDEVRAAGARLLNCTADDICILKNTTEGLSLVPLGLTWSDGDEIITYDREFPSDVYVFLALRDKGVNVKFIPDRGRYRFDLEDFEAMLSPRTRAVCLSLVNFAHGFRAPIEEIGRICKQRGIWLVVDAIQALGAMKVDAAALGADIISAHGYKFLLSGFGVSLCYCSPRAREELHVSAPGWKSIANATDINNMLSYNLDFPRSARRFESGVQNLAGVHGLGASISLMLEVGVQAAQDHVLALCSELAVGLQDQGFTLVSSTQPGEQSCVLSAFRENIDTGAIKADLAEKQVACAVREGRVRISPHFYNNSDDVRRLLSCLPS